MTTKQHYAMFAVAAVAIFSLAAAPSMQSVFATNIGSVSSTQTAQLNSKVYYSADHDNNVCGSGDVHLESSSYVKLHTAGDSVYVSYDFSDCSSQISKVEIEIKRGSTVLDTKEKTNLDSNHTFGFSGGLNGGDVITINVVGIV